LLAGEFKPGDKIKVTPKDDELVFLKNEIFVGALLR